MRRPMRAARRAIDVATMADAMRGPGMDTRQWVSYGIVSAEDPKDVVVFDLDFGAPLVSVTLQPSDHPVYCRVSSMIAGSGEGEYHPFVQGDEVLVLIPEGLERGGPVIVGRLNNKYDPFPMESVAGQDPTTNTFAFRRRRTPFVEEFAGPILFRTALTGAFLSIDSKGLITLRGGDQDALQVAPGVLNFQTGDAGAVLTVNGNDGQFLLQVGDVYMQLCGSGAPTQASTVLVPGTMSIGTSGNAPAEHVATTESVANLVSHVANLLGVALNAMGPTPLTGTMLGALLVTPVFDATLAGALGLAAASPVPTWAVTILPAIQAALMVQTQKLATPVGQLRPGIGCQGTLVG